MKIDEGWSHLMLLLLIMAFVIGCILTTGCSGITIPEKQLIPVKCQITMPDKPKQTARGPKDFQGIYNDTVEIQTYTELTESGLNFCNTGETNGN